MSRELKEERVLSWWRGLRTDDQELVSNMVRRHLLAHSDGPKTKAELHKYMQILHGINIPTTATTPDADAPMDFFWALYSRENPYIAAIASRSGGKTFLVSQAVPISMQFNKRSSIRHAASTKVQSEVAMAYLQDTLERPWYNDVYDRKATSSTKARWFNGSEYRIITGSKKGVSGQHPETLILDETEFWDIPSLNQSFAVPVGREGRPKLWCAVSTRQSATGGMAWLSDNADAKGIKFFRWTIFETMQPCETCVATDAHPYGTDEQRQSACPLWKYCHGTRAKKASGWLTRQEVIESLQVLSDDEIETQYLSERPLTRGRVLFNFVEDKYAPEGNLSRMTMDMTRPYIISMDPAEGQMAFMVFWQMDDEGVWNAVAELCIEECSSDIQAKEKLYEFISTRRWHMPEAIVVDPHRTDTVNTFMAGSPNGEGAGFAWPMTTTPDIKWQDGARFDDLTVTLNLVRRYIRSGMGTVLAVNPDTCPQLLKAIKYHGYKLNATTGDPTTVPSSQFKDPIDAMRYGVMYIEQKYGTLANLQVSFLRVGESTSKTTSTEAAIIQEAIEDIDLEQYLDEV